MASKALLYFKNIGVIVKIMTQRK